MFKNIIILILLSICTVSSGKNEQNQTIILATTTSVQDTGLLDVLVEKFQKETEFIVKPIAVGSGQAMQLGKNGEADILWVHSPDDEKKFIGDGFGKNRTTFMHNDFILLGPVKDPAGIKDEKDIVKAFNKVAQANVLFVSRGDLSGTHKKELKLWKESGIMPVKEKYLEVGQGMSATLRIADEKQAYCLVDRSSYLSLKDTINLIIVSEGDEKLNNYYSLILVNEEIFPKVNTKGAKALFDFLLSKKTKVIIENYGKEKFGRSLFYYDYNTQ